MHKSRNEQDESERKQRMRGSNECEEEEEA